MHDLQKTVKSKLIFSGIGVHSGQPSTITIWPAEHDTGIIFIKSSSAQHKIKIGFIIPEAAMHATVLSHDGWHLSTVEHLMAALMVLGVDNVVIEVHGNEIPILDGSAMLFVQGILDAGLLSLNAKRRYIMPREAVHFQDSQGRQLDILPPTFDIEREKLVLKVEYNADFNHPLVSSTPFDAIVTEDLFINELAPARTFGFLEQLPFLRQHKLAQGSALSNTIVIGNEVLNEQRFEDECIRHKVLDLIGDISLLGMPLVGTVKAVKTSHNFNRLIVEHFIKNQDRWVLI